MCKKSIVLGVLSACCSFALAQAPANNAATGAAGANGTATPQAAATAVSPDLAVFSAKIKDKKGLTWVITGDSITHGAMHTKGQRSYPEQVHERVRWEMRRFQDIFINSGISGDKTTGLLNGFEWRVLRFKPDIISINLGMNDSGEKDKGLEKYRNNLQNMIDQGKKAGAIVILHTPQPTVKPRPFLAEYAQAARELAVKNNLILVDNWQYWSEKVPNEAERKAWMNDNIHPNGIGHAEMAKTMLKALDLFDAKSPVCNMGAKN